MVHKLGCRKLFNSSLARMTHKAKCISGHNKCGKKKKRGKKKKEERKKERKNQGMKEKGREASEKYEYNQ